MDELGQRVWTRDVVNGAVGNFATNCMGYMDPGASGSGYIATMKLSVDSIPMDGLDPGAGDIVSYDRCEKDDAYIGQINMGTASSFCGRVPVYPVASLLDAAERDAVQPVRRGLRGGHGLDEHRAGEGRALHTLRGGRQEYGPVRPGSGCHLHLGLKRGAGAAGAQPTGSARRRDRRPRRRATVGCARR